MRGQSSGQDVGLGVVAQVVGFERKPRGVPNSQAGSRSPLGRSGGVTADQRQHHGVAGTGLAQLEGVSKELFFEIGVRIALVLDQYEQRPSIKVARRKQQVRRAKAKRRAAQHFGGRFEAVPIDLSRNVIREQPPSPGGRMDRVAERRLEQGIVGIGQRP